MEYTRFGEEMRVLRTRRHQSQKDMAEVLGVTKSFLSSVETGRRSIPKGWIYKNAVFDMDATAVLHYLRFRPVSTQSFFFNSYFLPQYGQFLRCTASKLPPHPSHLTRRNVKAGLYSAATSFSTQNRNCSSFSLTHLPA